MISLSLPIGDNYGWGICGRNLVRQFSSMADTQLFCPVMGDNDPLRELVPEDWNPNYPYSSGCDPMLHAVQGANLLPSNPNVWSDLHNVGYAFIEDIETAKRYVANGLRYFDRILTGSTWCTERLGDLGLPVETAIQGVDTSIFCPAAARPWGPLFKDDKFYIFSGGKFEYRKGQDIVIAAFKHLMDKYSDIHLVCSWGNLWPATMDTMRRSTLIQYPEFSTNDWHVKIRAVMAANGIQAHRYTSLPLYPQEQMADYYRLCDVALFPNRCEAGTNLPMMEAMACGVPVIGSMATGHVDVLDFEYCWMLSEGRFDQYGWFEPDLDMAVCLLEQAYLNREESRTLGLRGANAIKQFTWERTAAQILKVCM